MKDTLRSKNFLISRAKWMGRVGLLLLQGSILLSSCTSLNNSTSHSHSGPQSNRDVLLVSSDPILEFGTHPNGARFEAPFFLHNPSNSPVEVDTIHTSCECFSVWLQQKLIKPGEKVQCLAKVDLTRSKEFIGHLRFEAIGQTKSNNAIAFNVSGNVLVTQVQLEGR